MTTPTLAEAARAVLAAWESGDHPNAMEMGNLYDALAAHEAGEGKHCGGCDGDECTRRGCGEHPCPGIKGGSE